MPQHLDGRDELVEVDMQHPRAPALAHGTSLPPRASPVRVIPSTEPLEDPTLVRRLRDERIPLTVCPLSNVALRTAPSDLAQHPLPVMMAEGLLVSINSDDPAYFGGDVAENYRAIESALSLDAAQLATLARNSFESSFATDAAKAAWIAEVDAVLAQASG